MQLAQQAALINAKIKADSVGVQEFPELVARYSVRGVPKTVINDSVEFIGALPEEKFVEQLLLAVAPPA